MWYPNDSVRDMAINAVVRAAISHERKMEIRHTTRIAVSYFNGNFAIHSDGKVSFTDSAADAVRRLVDAYSSEVTLNALRMGE